MKRKYFTQLFEDAQQGTQGGSASQGTVGQGDGQNGQNGAQGASGGTSNNQDDKKYSDADVNRIIDKKFAEWQKKQEKAVADAAATATMNEQQRAEHERDQYKQELEDLRAANARNTLTSQVISSLSAEGYSVSMEQAALLVGADADTTTANTTAFIGMMKGLVQAAVKDALKGNTPSVGSTGSNITKEDIMKITDRTERQKMIAAHLDLFK